MMDRMHEDYAYLERRLMEAEATLASICRGKSEVSDPAVSRASARIVAARERDDHIKRVLRAIRNVNQLIVKETDRQRLIEGACAALTATLGYRDAWIVLRDAPDGSAAISSAGTARDTVERARRFSADGVPACMTRALDRDGIVAHDEPQAACDGCPLAGRREAKVCLTRRLALGDEVFGAITVTVPERYATDEEECALFEDLGDDIAYALRRISDEALREEAEAALRERVKELNCLYELGRIIEDSRDAPLAEILAQAVELLPPAFRYPADTVGRIRWRESTFATGDLATCRDRIEAGIRVFDEDVGCVAVGYRHEHPAAAEGPFLREERSLIDAVAERLGRISERIQSSADLRWREAMLARTERLAGIGSWEWEIATDTVTWSEELYRIFGRDPADGPPSFAGHDVLYLPEDLARLREAVAVAVSDGTSYAMDLRATRPDGEIRYCTAHGFPERGPDGRVRRLVGFLRDNTEQARAQEMYARVCEMATELICVADLRTATFTQINPAFLASLGYTEEELLGRSFLEFIHPDDVQQTREVIATMLDRGTTVIQFENRYRRRDGTYRYLKWNSHPVPEEGLTYAIAHDITDHRSALEALSRSEENYRLLAENTVDCIWRMDLEANFLYVNPASGTLLGYEPEEMVGGNLAAFCDRANFDLVSGVIASATAAFPDSEIRAFEAVLLHRDGTPVDVEINGRVIAGATGRPASVQGVIRDVTRRKRAERERSELEEQLHQSRKLEAVGRLAGGVAHDFNNLLMVIRNYCDLLRASSDVEEVRADLMEISHAADRAADLTHQLLAFSRKQIIEPKVIDLNDAVMRVEKMLRRVIGEDIDLLLEMQPGLAPTRFDPGQAEQILLNLAANARDAMPHGGQLTIETQNRRLDEGYESTHRYTPAGDYVMLAVSDSGRGMDEQTMLNVFEPFYTTKAQGKGTGLGLATVYGIVKQHGGSIELYSELGVGTTFKIYLPVASGQEVAEVLAEEKPPAPGDETILLVEDEPAVRRVAARVLMALDYTVLAAASPSEAIRICREHGGAIQLVVTDVVMPEMSGRDCYERLAEIRPGLKVLFMSGYTENVIAHRGVLDEGTHFIQKPFTAQGLARKVRDTLDT